MFLFGYAGLDVLQILGMESLLLELLLLEREVIAVDSLVVLVVGRVVEVDDVVAGALSALDVVRHVSSVVLLYCRIKPEYNIYLIRMRHATLLLLSLLSLSVLCTQDPPTELSRQEQQLDERQQ